MPQAFADKWSTPVLVGLAVATQRGEDSVALLQATELMIQAVRRAATVPVSAGGELRACPGAGIAGRAALAAADLEASAVDLVNLYSCFPLAVEVYAEELWLSPERDLTVTGGVAYAGGPHNNDILQAACRKAELLSAGAGQTSLVSPLSGIVTKQAFGRASRAPVGSTGPT